MKKLGLTRLAFDAAIIISVVIAAIYVVSIEAAANDLETPPASAER